MANRPLHIGVIGCGAQAQNHLSVVRELGDEIARVQVICDLREERLEEGRALWPEARLCRDYREALKDGDLDLVIVVTMPATHAEICLAAFAARGEARGPVDGSPSSTIEAAPRLAVVGFRDLQRRQWAGRGAVRRRM